MRISMAFALTISLFCTFLFTSQSYAKEQQGIITIHANLNAPTDAKNVRLWIPYPVSDENQDITDVNIKGNFTSQGIYRDARFGNNILYAEWRGNTKERSLTYTFNVKRRQHITKDFPKKEMDFSKEEFSKYLESTKSLPITSKVKQYADKITKGKKTIFAKARAIYDWIVDNMYRDPNVKGCGLGEVETLLETKGGKCADIHILNPKQDGASLNYFMYPYAEADGKPLNEDLYGFNIGYKITFKEL